MLFTTGCSEEDDPQPVADDPIVEEPGNGEDSDTGETSNELFYKLIRIENLATEITFFDRNNIHYIDVLDGVEAVVGISNNMRLEGDFFLTDTTRTRFVVTHLASNVQTIFPARSTTTSSIVFFTIPEDFERGYYSSVLITGEKTIEEDSIWIKHPQPVLTWPGR